MGWETVAGAQGSGGDIAAADEVWDNQGSPPKNKIY